MQTKQTIEVPKTDAPPAVMSEMAMRHRSDRFNEGTKMKQLIHEEYNTGRNIAPLLQMIKDGRARDIDDEPKVENVPFFVIGSGGSLDDVLPHMGGWKGGIICSTSHARTLIYHGIEPTHIVALDPFCQWNEIEGIDWSKTRTKLVAHPGVWPDLIENWPNDILLFRQDMAQSDSFYATTQMHMFTNRSGTRDDSKFDVLIRTTITLFACTPPAQLFVGDKLGYAPCFLAGMDFGYGTGRERFTTYTPRGLNQVVSVGNAPPAEVGLQWTKEEHPFVMPNVEDPEYIKTHREQERVAIGVNGKPTNQINIFYKKNLISAWRLSRAMVYTTTPNSNMPEVPYMPIEKVIRLRGKAKMRNEKWIKKTTERYLAATGAFVIESEDGGVNFIESNNPEAELSAWMAKMRAQYQCEQCGLMAINETNAEPTEPCPRCETGKFVRRHAIDMAANLARIQGLLKWVADNPA